MTDEPKEPPLWWRRARKLWVEDDSLTYDREMLEQAWKRLFGVERKTEVRVEEHDAGDAVFILYESNRVACASYPGNCEIRIISARAVP